MTERSPFRGTPGYWALVAGLIAVVAAMAGWSYPLIAAEAGGLPAFDLRVAGYGLNEAQAFLAALSETGRVQYLRVHAVLDSIFAPLMFAVVGIALWHLSADMQKVTRGIVVAVAAVGMIADGFENVVVREMLVAGAGGLTAEMVAEASAVTVVKSAAYGASLIALAVIALRALRRGRAA
ncbi:MAG: hypothetical protein AAFQ79_16555 [Pseudomonadota bacterium]